MTIIEQTMNKSSLIANRNTIKRSRSRNTRKAKNVRT